MLTSARDCDDIHLQKSGYTWVRKTSRGVLLTFMALLPYTPEAAWADNLIARLAEHGITYITGGHPLETPLVANIYAPKDRALIVQLIADLVDAPSVRLVDSIVALLSRHPDYAPLAREVLGRLSPADQRSRSLLA
jgi:hypothetical protein